MGVVGELNFLLFRQFDYMCLTCKCCGKQDDGLWVCRMVLY